MSKIRILKILTDIAMTVLLPLLMAYTLVGEAAHEWLGLAMLLLFIAHHALNLGRLSGLGKGRCSCLRVLNTTVNLLLCADFVFLAVSSVMLSNHVFDFLHISGGMEFARRAHMLSSYWGFVLMSFHLGLHWNMAVGMLKSVFGKQQSAPRHKWLLRVIAWGTAGYGVYAFVKRKIGVYLFYRSHFVFFDFDEGLWPYLADYSAVIVLFAALGYYFGKLLQSTGVPCHAAHTP